MDNKRKPAQEDLAYDDVAAANEALGASAEQLDPLTIETPGGQPVKPKPYSPDPNEAIARGLTGAAPALLGFLFGASPLTAENQILDAKKFYEKGKPSKLVTIAGPDGQPIYEDQAMAVGKQAYQKPVSAKAPSMAGMKQQTYIDKQNNPIYTQALPSGDVIEYGTKRNVNDLIASGELRPAVDVSDRVKTKDMYGNETLATVPKFGQSTNISKTQLSEGYGAKYGLPEKDVVKGDQYAQSYLTAAKPIYDSKAQLKGAVDLLNAPDTDPVKQSAGVFRTAKAIVNERISDQERGVVTLPPGMLEKLRDKIDSAVNNVNPQETLRQLRGVLVDLDRANDLALASMQDRTIQAYAAGDRKKAKYLSDKIVSGSKISVGMQNTQSPIAPPAQLPKKSPERARLPELTEAQWNALPEAKRRQIIEQKRLSNQAKGL